MILKERIEILNELFQSASTVLKQYEALSTVASSALEKAKAWMESDNASPAEIIDMFKRIHDMQMQSLSTFNSILEKFPVEHTIQELQMLELFRNMTERQKQQLMTQLEQFILQKKR